jgi:aromatic ring-opening dioxygenase catalytic subunit (LigB family)
MSTQLMPIVYLPHGGGPLPLLGDPDHKDLTAFLKGLHERLPQPKAILMMSAHWEHAIAAISAGSHPGMIYDYGGFPPESYTFQYPAPGDPALAQQVATLLQKQGIEHVLDAQRGYDHGTFVPLMLMYPEADVPVVQVSLLHSLDAEQHLALGKALAPLREQGVLIVGSGLSFHARGTFEHSVAFDDWLTETLVDTPMAEALQRLAHWTSAPAARDCHQREEHLLPVHVCLGAASAAGKTAHKVFSGLFYGKQISGFLWD